MYLIFFAHSSFQITGLLVLMLLSWLLSSLFLMLFPVWFGRKAFALCFSSEAKVYELYTSGIVTTTRSFNSICWFVFTVWWTEVYEGNQRPLKNALHWVLLIALLTGCLNNPIKSLIVYGSDNTWLLTLQPPAFTPASSLSGVWPSSRDGSGRGGLKCQKKSRSGPS